MATLARAAGDHLKALYLLDESILLHRDVGDAWSLSRALVERSHLALQQTDFAQADQSAREAFLQAAGSVLWPNALDALAALAEVFVKQERKERALEISIRVLKHPMSTRNAKKGWNTCMRVWKST